MITFSTLEHRPDLEGYVLEAMDLPFIPMFIRTSTPGFRVYDSMSDLMGGVAGLMVVASELEKKELGLDFYFVLSCSICAPWEKIDYVAFFAYWMKRLDLKFVGIENKPIIIKAKPPIDYDYALDKFFDFSPLFFSYERKCLKDGETYKQATPYHPSILEMMNDNVQVRSSSNGDKR